MVDGCPSPCPPPRLQPLVACGLGGVSRRPGRTRSLAWHHKPAGRPALAAGRPRGMGEDPEGAGAEEDEREERGERAATSGRLSRTSWGSTRGQVLQLSKTGPSNAAKALLVGRAILAPSFTAAEVLALNSSSSLLGSRPESSRGGASVLQVDAALGEEAAVGVGHRRPGEDHRLGDRGTIRASGSFMMPPATATAPPLLIDHRWPCQGWMVDVNAGSRRACGNLPFLLRSFSTGGLLGLCRLGCDILCMAGAGASINTE